jgi:hypothetical protein
MYHSTGEIEGTATKMEAHDQKSDGAWRADRDRGLRAVPPAATKIEALDQKPDGAWRADRDRGLRAVPPGAEENHGGELVLLVAKIHPWREGLASACYREQNQRSNNS